ncbi:hypothetical protein [Zavarzinella formosa]|nr:hypothetical protein [Zavarzinella formosa]
MTDKHALLASSVLLGYASVVTITFLATTPFLAARVFREMTQEKGRT